MLVVFVVNVDMRMFQNLMRMFMLVLLGKVQPDAERHQTTGEQQRQRHWLAHRNRQCGAKKGAIEK